MVASPAPCVCFGPGEALKDRSAIRLRLICVPQAGMGAWAFHGWQRHLPPSVELMPVELPGRNSRMLEDKPATMRELVTDLASGLKQFGALDLPYVLLGHSFGGLVAYELIAELERRRERTPLLLVVSAVRPPHLRGLEHDADTETPAIAKLDEPAFWAAFERRYGVNPDLADNGVKAFVLPLLRADFGLFETFEPSRDRAPLPCAIVACAAALDNRVLPGHMAQWGEYAAEGQFREAEAFALTPLPWSTPHRYVVECPAPLHALLKDECTRLLSQLDKEPEPPVTAAASTEPATAAKAETKPVPSISVVELLEQAGCAAYAEAAAGCTMAEWCELLDSSRPAFLKMLVEALGVAKLAERQAIANALGKARRAAVAK